MSHGPGNSLPPIIVGDQDDIDFAKFDYTRPFEFAILAESREPSIDTLPLYRSRASSVGQVEQGLPAYPIDDDLAAVVEAVYAQNAELLKKPKYRKARPLPREFSEEEIREIRRKTRHRIRAVTRNSLGLTVTLGLSSVAPQMLIAAAINGFLLGRGAYKLHQHLRFLKWNNLKVRKRDVVVAVIEGIAVKMIFLAITLNHDDFLVLTHELVHSHSDVIASAMHSVPALHNIPIFDHANHFFDTPIEKVQQALHLPSMAERALEHTLGIGSSAGGWLDDPTMVLKNMFFVGAVQSVMEFAIERLQDHMGRASDKVKDMTKQKRDEKKGREREQWTRNKELMFKSSDKYEMRYFKR